MMTELTVTAKGQVTLKKSVLEHLGVKPGEKLSVMLRPDGRVELQPAARKRDINAVKGLLWRPDQRALSIEEIEEGIAEGAVESYLNSL